MGTAASTPDGEAREMVEHVKRSTESWIVRELANLLKEKDLQIWGEHLEDFLLCASTHFVMGVYSGEAWTMGSDLERAMKEVGAMSQEVWTALLQFGQQEPSAVEVFECAFDMRVNLKDYPMKTLLSGFDIELEHGLVAPRTNVTNDHIRPTLKITLAHLAEIPDYYERLERLEKEGEEFWKRKKKPPVFT